MFKVLAGLSAYIYAYCKGKASSMHFRFWKTGRYLSTERAGLSVNRGQRAVEENRQETGESLHPSATCSVCVCLQLRTCARVEIFPLQGSSKIEPPGSDNPLSLSLIIACYELIYQILLSESERAALYWLVTTDRDFAKDSALCSPIFSSDSVKDQSSRPTL